MTPRVIDLTARRDPATLILKTATHGDVTVTVAAEGITVTGNGFAVSTGGKGRREINLSQLTSDARAREALNPSHDSHLAPARAYGAAKASGLSYAEAAEIAEPAAEPAPKRPRFFSRERWTTR